MDTGKAQSSPSPRASPHSAGGDTRGTPTRGARRLRLPSTTLVSPAAPPLAVSPARAVEPRLCESEPSADSQKPVGRCLSVGGLYFRPDLGRASTATRRPPSRKAGSGRPGDETTDAA